VRASSAQLDTCERNKFPGSNGKILGGRTPKWAKSAQLGVQNVISSI
jgi:hypothetical protein